MFATLLPLRNTHTENAFKQQGYSSNDAIFPEVSQKYMANSVQGIQI